MRDLLDWAGIAALAGSSRAPIDAAMRRPDFPQPVATLLRGGRRSRLFDREAVEAHLAAHGPKGRRPPTIPATWRLGDPGVALPGEMVEDAALGGDDLKRRRQANTRADAAHLAALWLWHPAGPRAAAA